MPDGGTLTIRTSKAEITQAPRTEDDLAIGHYAMLAVQDTGTGMVYGFAKQSGGTVSIASEPGRGTTVIIYIAADPQ